MDRGSLFVAAAWSRMQKRDWLRSQSIGSASAQNGASEPRAQSPTMYSGLCGLARRVQSVRVCRLAGCTAPSKGRDSVLISRSPGRRWLMRRTLVLFAALSVAGVLLFAPGAPRALAAFPGHNGKISFERFGDDDVDIWTMSPDGRHQVNLTPDPSAFEFGSRWSADGRRIVFSSNRVTAADPTPGDFEIFVMDADGSHQRQITFNSFDDFDPAWSPDGDRVVFDRFFGDFEI